MKKVAITSLGCPRNLVDSEVLAGHLKKDGFRVSGIDEGADVLIINTCSFVGSAREEAIDTILGASQLKKDGKIKYIVVAGCLPQMYKGGLLDELPEVDAILGTGDISKIGDIVKGLKSGRRSSVVSDRSNYLYDENSPRESLLPKHYAYIKISEGCDNFCSYCAISQIRGRLRSRTIESVIREAKALLSPGYLREINLIGQDTSLFGKDIYGKPVLAKLLKELAGLKNGVRWVRLLYTHPAHYTDELIETIRDEGKICKYLDMPIQHASDSVLARMNRPTTKKDIAGLIERLRGDIPSLTLRTSVIVGFPGETDKDFKELLEFLSDVKFDRLGVFIYSREENTPAHDLKDQIPEKIKSERFDEVMRLQQKISDSLNKTFLGKVIDVLIDEKIEGEEDKYLGRGEADAPEVDGSIYVTGARLHVGEFYKVKITDTLEYDLVGEAL